MNENNERLKTLFRRLQQVEAQIIKNMQKIDELEQAMKGGEHDKS